MSSNEMCAFTQIFLKVSLTKTVHDKGVRKINFERGYAALMSVLVVGAALMSLVVSLSDVGILSAKYFEALRGEKQSLLSALGCRDLAMLYVSQYGRSVIQYQFEEVKESDIDCLIRSAESYPPPLGESGEFFIVKTTGIYKEWNKDVISHVRLNTNSISLIDSMVVDNK